MHWMNINKERQGVSADVGENVMEFKVRYKVSHDTSYSFQSSAIAEVWSDTTLTWNRVADYHYSQWADNKISEDGATEGIWEALNELRARALAVLDPEHI